MDQRQFKSHKASPTTPAGTGALKKAEPDSVRAGEKSAKVKEIGGPRGPEPTRYGDWERKGICVDF